MSVLLSDSAFFFGTIPKVGCTSMKKFLYELSTGTKWKPYKSSGKMVYIHDFMPGIRWPDYPDLNGVERWTMVRDPIKRFVSAYQHRVVSSKELELPRSQRIIQAMNLPLQPDIETFIEHFHDYCAASHSVGWHMRPQIDWIGTRTSFWDKIFPIQEIETVGVLLSQRLQAVATLPHSQRSPKFNGTLSNKHTRFLEDIYSADYAIYGAYF